MITVTDLSMHYGPVVALHKANFNVERGEVVGRVGNTGCSLGSHLHFAVRRNGDFVDPLRYLPRR